MQKGIDLARTFSEKLSLKQVENEYALKGKNQ
jgi:hypothetical protein